MKIMDLSLIFIGIILPFVIILYVNVSFTIKAQEQEIYYKQVIDLASEDATNEMKEVENEDATIDYGYSGLLSKKISVNSQVAVDTFLDSMYNNFGIYGNEAAESYLQLFVPAITVIDYDGVQVSSIESYTENGEELMSHVLKPKRYYSYIYTIASKGTNWEIVDGYIKQGQNGYTQIDSYHQIDFTMDDYITHRWSTRGAGTNFEQQAVKSFYITDENNNYNLIGDTIVDNVLLLEVTERLQEVRQDIIVDTLVKEMAYATNNNNSYAKSAGITYSFSFPTTTQSELYGSVESVGLMSFVQGLSIGNKYLNTKSYGITSLELSTRYYFTIARGDEVTISSDYESVKNLNLYHKTKKCSLYKILSVGISNISPKYVLTKQRAASTTVRVKQGGMYHNYEGFYPCPLCVP